MRNSDRLRRTITVLAQDQIGLAAPRVVPLEGVRAVQQNDHVGILFKAVVD